MLFDLAPTIALSCADNKSQSKKLRKKINNNLKPTPLCCHQTHLLKQTHFGATATLHLLLLTKTILLSPALSDSQQKRAIADKILGISPKWANYEPCFL